MARMPRMSPSSVWQEKRNSAAFSRLRMLPGESVLLHEEPEVPPGLDQAVVDGGVLRATGAGPGAIGQLLSQDSLGFRQFPETADRADRLPEEITPGEVSERLVLGREQRTDGIELQLLAASSP